MISSIVLFGLMIYSNRAPDYAVLLGQKLKGSEQQKTSSVISLRKWCNYYDVSQEKMYKVMSHETRTNFYVYAYNPITKARGPCQVTEQALLDIPEGKLYFKYEIIEGIKTRIVDKYILYNIDMNIRAGCSYMAICERRAPLYRNAMPLLLKLYLNEDEVSLLLYCLGAGHIRQFISGMDYVKVVSK